LLTAYTDALSEGRIQRDAQLDRLVEITQEGYLDDYIFYEICARMYPDFVLTMQSEIRDGLTEFIAKYVVVDDP